MSTLRNKKVDTPSRKDSAAKSTFSKEERERSPRRRRKRVVFDSISHFQVYDSEVSPGADEWLAFHSYFILTGVGFRASFNLLRDSSGIENVLDFKRAKSFWRKPEERFTALLDLGKVCCLTPLLNDRQFVLEAYRRFSNVNSRKSINVDNLNHLDSTQLKNQVIKYEEEMEKADISALRTMSRRYLSEKADLLLNERFLSWFAAFLTLKRRLRNLDEMRWMNVFKKAIASEQFQGLKSSDMSTALKNYLLFLTEAAECIESMDTEVLHAFSKNKFPGKISALKSAKFLDACFRKTRANFNSDDGTEFLTNARKAWTALKDNVTLRFNQALNTFGICAMLNNCRTMLDVLGTIETPEIVKRRSEKNMVSGSQSPVRKILPDITKTKKNSGRGVMQCAGVSCTSIVLKQSLRADLQFSQTNRTHEWCEGHMCLLLRTMMRSGFVKEVAVIAKEDLSFKLLAQKKLCVGALESMAWINPERSTLPDDVMDGWIDDSSIILWQKYEQLPFVFCVSEFISEIALGKPSKITSTNNSVVEAGKLLLDLVNNGVKLKYKIPTLWNLIPILDKIRLNLNGNQGTSNINRTWKRYLKTSTINRRISFWKLFLDLVNGSKGDFLALLELLKNDSLQEHQQVPTMVALRSFRFLWRSIKSDLMTTHNQDNKKVDLMLQGILLQGIALQSRWELLMKLLQHRKLTDVKTQTHFLCLSLLNEIESTNVIKRKVALKGLLELQECYQALDDLVSDDIERLVGAMLNICMDHTYLMESEKTLFSTIFQLPCILSFISSKERSDECGTVLLHRLCQEAIFQGLWDIFDISFPRLIAALLDDNESSSKRSAIADFFGATLATMIDRTMDTTRVEMLSKKMATFLPVSTIAFTLFNQLDMMMHPDCLETSLLSPEILLHVVEPFLQRSYALDQQHCDRVWKNQKGLCEFMRLLAFDIQFRVGDFVYNGDISMSSIRVKLFHAMGSVLVDSLDAEGLEIFLDLVSPEQLSKLKFGGFFELLQNVQAKTSDLDLRFKPEPRDVADLEVFISTFKKRSWFDLKVTESNYVLLEDPYGLVNHAVEKRLKKLKRKSSKRKNKMKPTKASNDLLHTVLGLQGHP